MKKTKFPSKILIADDHSTIRLLLKKQLQAEGYDIAVASNGKQAIQVAEELRPALIICDWMMPEMDGIQVCRKLKSDKQFASIFFILLTAKGEITDRVEGLDAGADDFLSKPVEPSELLARVRAGIRLYDSQQEFIKTNQKLSQTLRDLQSTQSQLIQAEKMSSLGKMVAGVAHEINNPVTFIQGNLVHARNYVEDLMDLAKLALNSREPEMKEAAEEMELDFLMEDLPKVLDSMQKGAKRISEIVVSLRNFSRLDEAEMKEVNIHEGIESTLSMLQYRLSGIEVVKNYSDIPNIECYPGQLNQVFINILSNAIDVLKSTKNVSPLPSIEIYTGLADKKQVEIKISDNGPGIDVKVLPRIFEPFFTTKQVGAGKGLGLSTSYSIVVDKHRGELNCVSTPGNGAIFEILIPISQKG
ncbi:MAG: response regulator [Cyanobacteriota bacterium]|nr:response regulator [Cyanobacteriota bacterium]